MYLLAAVLALVYSLVLFIYFLVKNGRSAPSESAGTLFVRALLYSFGATVLSLVDFIIIASLDEQWYGVKRLLLFMPVAMVFWTAVMIWFKRRGQ